MAEAPNITADPPETPSAVESPPEAGGPDEAAQAASPDEGWDELLGNIDSDEEEIGVARVEETETPEEGGTEAEAEAEAAPAEAEQSGDDTTDPDQEQPTPANGEDLERSLAALRRDGLPQDVISKMTNEDIISLGLKRMKVQGDVDDAYRQLQELKAAKETAPESDTAEEQTPAVAPVANLNEAVQPFADIFGEDAAEALKGVQNAALQPLIDMVKTTQNMVEGVLMDSSRTALADQYPQLSTDASFQKVRTRMESLIKTGDYSDVDALMADAARIEFSDEAAVASRELNTRRQRQKAEGQLTPTDKAATPAKAMSVEEREVALLEALEDGMKLSEAQRLYGATST